MFRRSVLASWLVAGCVADAPVTTDIQADVTSSFTREHVTGDIYHYELVVPVGDTPNAALRIHRVVRELAPYVPRPSARAAMLLHGDFSTFVTNFVPMLGEPSSPVTGLAPYLAARDVDVWGVDRRWTLTATDGDVSDFGAMGVEQDVDDIRRALAFARASRAASGQGGDRLALVGYSHGGQLAYVVAAVEGGLAPGLRHVDAIVPLDFYGDLGPEDAERRAELCRETAEAYPWIADGFIDWPNDFFITIGQLARLAPSETSPVFPRLTNRGAMLRVAAETYRLAPFAPSYHFAAPVLDEAGNPVALRESSELAIEVWFEGAPPHQAVLESVDLDALLCGEAPPIDAPLSQVGVPVLYIGAAGGIGVNGLHATTQVGTSDVTTLMVQRFDADRRAEDFGHADLLFATDAPALVWQPLASWLLQH